jgi:signal transduction histidine kinase
MTLWLEHRATEIRNAIRNPHTWIIIFIILILASVYYSHLFFIDISESRWKWLWYLVFFEFKYTLNGSLFLIPFIYAAIVFRWPGTLIVLIFSLGLMLPRTIYMVSNTGDLIINLIMFTIPLLAVIMVTLLKKWREAGTTALTEREKKRQVYIKGVINAQEDERKRIAREIHDDTTQKLWLLANRANKLVTDELQYTLPGTAAELIEFKEMLLRLSADTRKLSVALRPGVLDDLGPIAAIKWLIDQLCKDFPIEAKIIVKGSQHQLSPELSIQIFRIAQEALNNVRRHSEANQVIIKLEFRSETIKMTIRDNGKGFSLLEIRKQSAPDKLGLLGIKERVRLLDGISKIYSKPQKGTLISVVFHY